jgi:1,4-dihydroxy-2-naphthoate octaprenyltransferase
MQQAESTAQPPAYKEYRSLGAWVQAARPNTLPLALSGIVLGTSCAGLYTRIDWGVAGMAILTATLLQILSNFANDYGDADLGADTAARIGPQRMVSTGQIGMAPMRRALLLMSALSLLCGLGLLAMVLDRIGWAAFGGLLAAGLLAIAAAILYTVSSANYGYKGMGDLAVLLFFGLLSVGGAFYLQTGHWSHDLWIPAIGFGLLSTAVLNVNNLRDRETDRLAGKMTLPVRLGLEGARRYHLSLVLGGLIMLQSFVFARTDTFLGPGVALPPMLLAVLVAKQVVRLENPYALEPMLKKTALSVTAATLAVSVALHL